MLFNFIKIFSKVALHFYCKKLVVNNPSILNIKGPLIIAANHPNSFLDAIILATIFKKPIYSLTRGDAFNNYWIAKLLYALNMLPIYRISEGPNNINKNYHTFSACIDIFKKDGIVLIFSEGICINEWHLKPLKKGTARLALLAWQQNIPVQILPLGINYNNFYKFIKVVHINVGNCINKQTIILPSTDANAITAINQSIYQSLAQLVYEFSLTEKQEIAKKFIVKKALFANNMYKFLAAIGYFINKPHYFIIKKIVTFNLNDKDHFDSIIVGALFITYPLFVLIFCVLFYFAFGIFYIGIPLFFMPLCAWIYVQNVKIN